MDRRNQPCSQCQKARLLMRKVGLPVPLLNEQPHNRQPRLLQPLHNPPSELSDPSISPGKRSFLARLWAGSLLQHPQFQPTQPVLDQPSPQPLDPERSGTL